MKPRRRQFLNGIPIVCSMGFISFIGMLNLAEAKALSASKSQPRVIYPKKTELDFEGMRIEGELKNPGEFYFQHRSEEKFDSLVKRRKNFHRELLRDVVLSR